MKNRIHILIAILIINCLGQMLHAAGLIQELSTFSTKLTNLTKKLAQEGPGRPLPPMPPGGPVTPPPPTPVKPKEPSEPEPKFTKRFTFAYAETPQRTSTYIKIGFVGGDLIVYGPRLAEGVTPQDFIVQKEIKIPGEALSKKEYRLSFPVDKAKGITWSTENKIINEGPLANFVLVKATDYKALQEQEQNIQDLIGVMLPEVKKTIAVVSAQIPGGIGAFVNKQAAETWLNKIQQATTQCEFIRDNNLSHIIKKDVDELDEKTRNLINISLKKARAGKFTDIVTNLEKEEEKLNKCLVDIADIQKKPWLGDVLYRFYETYLKTSGAGAPSPISDWWVASERKITKPVIPEKPAIPEKPTEPTGSTEPPSDSIKSMRYELQFAYSDYRTATDAERKNAMSSITTFKNPKTGKLFTLRELLAYYIDKVDPDEREKLYTDWKQYTDAENYTWPKRD